MKKIVAKIKEVINNFLDSLNNSPGKGWSGRKLTALFAVIVGGYITKYKLPEEAQLHALYAWQCLALLCLGIVTIEQIIKLKNGNNEGNTTDNNPTV
jgi:hypothetical protein